MISARSFTQLALAATYLLSLASTGKGHTLSVWTPAITYPSSDTYWTIGDTDYVAWDASNPPEEVTNADGTLYLWDSTQAKFIDIDDPVATGFPLDAGNVGITVPSVPPGAYQLSLGDPSNLGPVFQIVP